MNIFEYKQSCDERVEELEKELLMAKARCVAVDEIIAMGISLPTDTVCENTEEPEFAVEQEINCNY